MKTSFRIILVMLMAVGLLSQFNVNVHSQGTFQNLDFEAANLTPIPAGQYGDFVPISQAIPYWRGYIGTNQVTQVLQNNLTLGAPSIDIVGPNWDTAIIEGRYTAVLQAGFTPGNPLVSASLAQAGLVPAGTQSILLKANAFANFSVSLNRQNIALVRMGTGPNYALYGGDASRFAGQEAELTLAALASGVPATPNSVDSITFSSQPIALSPLSMSITSTNTLLFSWPAAPGPVALQQSTDLITPEWLTLTNVSNGAGSQSQATIAKPTGTMFYRLAWR